MRKDGNQLSESIVDSKMEHVYYIVEFPQTSRTRSWSTFRSRSTTAGQLSSLYSLPSRLLVRTRGITRWLWTKDFVFLGLYAPVPRPLTHSFPISCFKILLRSYCCCIYVLYSRRLPACCDRDHVVALRNLRLRAFTIHPLVRTRVCPAVPRLGPQRSCRSSHLVAPWRNMKNVHHSPVKPSVRSLSEFLRCPEIHELSS